MKKRLLITGASGFLGQHLCHLALEQLSAEAWEIYGTFAVKAAPIASVQWIHLDLQQPHALQSTLDQLQPTAMLSPKNSFIRHVGTRSPWLNTQSTRFLVSFRQFMAQTTG